MAPGRPGHRLLLRQGSSSAPSAACQPGHWHEGRGRSCFNRSKSEWATHVSRPPVRRPAGERPQWGWGVSCLLLPAEGARFACWKTRPVTSFVSLCFSCGFCKYSTVGFYFWIQLDKIFVPYLEPWIDLHVIKLPTDLNTPPCSVLAFFTLVLGLFPASLLSVVLTMLWVSFVFSHSIFPLLASPFKETKGKTSKFAITFGKF